MNSLKRTEKYRLEIRIIWSATPMDKSTGTKCIRADTPASHNLERFDLDLISAGITLTRVEELPRAENPLRIDICEKFYALEIHCTYLQSVVLPWPFIDLSSCNCGPKFSRLSAHHSYTPYSNASLFIHHATTTSESPGFSALSRPHSCP